MYIYIYMYIHICIYICIHIYMYVYIKDSSKTRNPKAVDPEGYATRRASNEARKRSQEGRRRSSAGNLLCFFVTLKPRVE